MNDLIAPRTTTDTPNQPTDGPPLRAATYKVGWYQIGRSDEFPSGRVVTLRYFGQEFVAFRGADGKVGVFDPYCPHLGAHLGAGRIVDGKLRCVFHGWQFKGDGSCDAIPYAGAIPTKARLHVWDTCEVHGSVFLYYDPEHNAPSYPVPSVPDFDAGAYSSPYCNEVTGRLQPYDLYENSVDMGHFVFIHGFTRLPVVQFDPSPWLLRTSFESQVSMWGRKQAVTFRAQVHGPGISLTWIDTGLRLWTYLNATPIDPDNARIFVTNFVEKASIPAVLRPIVQPLFAWQFMFNLRRDVQIFSKRLNLGHPVLCGGDGPIVLYRSWFSRLPDAIRTPRPVFAARRRDGAPAPLCEADAGARIGVGQG